MRKFFLTFLSFYLILFSLASSVFAESKPNFAPGQIIPKIPKTTADPILENGGVYPMWGPVCQRYTYHTIYRDKEGRPPEYVRLYFNGNWIDVDPTSPKTSLSEQDYKKGVTYAYEFVPNKIGPNFFFFETSNGKGKTREGIIDSPGNGPVLFEGDFLHNQVVLIDKETGKIVLDYPTGNQWIGGVALSDDGRYLAVKTSLEILLFDTTKPEKPLWVYSSEMGNSPMMIGGDVKGGVAISGDGSKIFASQGDQVILFSKGSSRPVWQSSIGNAYNVAISKDGNYVAAATAGSETNENSNLLVLWNVKSSKLLWQYHSSGNFHDVSLSADGKYVVGATGCPDRKAYIFSRDSNKPIMQSDQLTYDSPVSRSKISSDGSLAVFNTDGGPNSSMLFLFSRNSKIPLWKFNAPISRSSRALGISPDGNFIGIADMTGSIYLFGKEKNAPLKEWKINATIGALDIADDGSFLAVGGTDNKLYLLDKAGGRKEFNLNEFVQEIDISGNGKHVAAGTGGSNYFFEEVISPNKQKIYDCAKVIEPETPFLEALKLMKGEGDNGQNKFVQALAGKKNSSSFGLLGKIVNFFKKVFGFESEKNIPDSDLQEETEKQEIEGECGNTICEPMRGENKQNCPRDCSGEN